MGPAGPAAARLTAALGFFAGALTAAAGRPAGGRAAWPGILATSTETGDPTLPPSPG